MSLGTRVLLVGVLPMVVVIICGVLCAANGFSEPHKGLTEVMQIVLGLAAMLIAGKRIVEVGICYLHDKEKENEEILP